MQLMYLKRIYVEVLYKKLYLVINAHIVKNNIQTLYITYIHICIYVCTYRIYVPKFLK